MPTKFSKYLLGIFIIKEVVSCKPTVTIIELSTKAIPQLNSILLEKNVNSGEVCTIFQSLSQTINL